MLNLITKIELLIQQPNINPFSTNKWKSKSVNNLISLAPAQIITAIYFNNTAIEKLRNPQNTISERNKIRPGATRFQSAPMSFICGAVKRG